MGWIALICVLAIGLTLGLSEKLAAHEQRVRELPTVCYPLKDAPLTLCSDGHGGRIKLFPGASRVKVGAGEYIVGWRAEN